jgi:ATP-dependent Zn protease
MGGRAAEHVVFSHFSTGAADDLAKIADIARSIVTRYAMVQGAAAHYHDDEELSHEVCTER